MEKFNYNPFDLNNSFELNPYNFNNIDSISDQQNYINENEINSFWLEAYDDIQNNKKDDNLIDNETTKLKTKNNLNNFNNIFQANQESLNNEDDNDYYINAKKDNLQNDNKNIINKKLDSFTYEKIKQIFENGKFNGISKKFVETEMINNAEAKLCNKKRKRDSEFVILLDDNDNKEEKKKRGRKIEGRKKSKGDHDNLSEDNVIKKIKGKFFYYSLLFLNKMIKGKENDTNKLYKLDYKYINQIKKEKDLNYLNMSLKDLFSLEISPKYKLAKQHNKEIINKIIQKEISVNDYKTTMFVLNLSFGNWIELFTYKKTIKQIIKDCRDVNYNSIINNFEGVEVLLKKILDKNNEDYFSFFTFLVYNYKRWFDMKRNRKNK